MKEKLNLRNAILWTVALAALIMFIASFGANATFKGMVGGDYFDATMSNVVWGSKYAVAWSHGMVTGEALKKAVVNVPGLIGALLLLLASGGIVAVTFLVKDEKMAKILTFVCGGAILVAGVLLFFVCEAPWYFLKESMAEEGISITIASLKQAYAGVKTASAYGIGGGIVAILLAGGVIASQLIKNIQFIKSK